VKNSANEAAIGCLTMIGAVVGIAALVAGFLITYCLGFGLEIKSWGFIVLGFLLGIVGKIILEILKEVKV